MDTEYGTGVGRTKKEAEHKAAAAAWTRARPGTERRCPNCPRSRSCGGDCRRTSRARPSPRSACTIRAPCAGTRPGPADLTARLLDARITGTGRRGKYLWLTARRWRVRRWWSTSGMSGQMLLGPVPRDRSPAHRRTARRRHGAELRRPAHVRRLDARRPGHRRRHRGARARRAPRPRSARPAFDRDAVVKVLRRKHSEIKRQLLDQTVVSGIGNIYADEALWRAQVNGARHRPTR